MNDRKNALGAAFLVLVWVTVLGLLLRQFYNNPPEMLRPIEFKTMDDINNGSH